MKLTTYISDIFGVSGRALLESVINGEVLEADAIKDKVKTSLKRKVPELLEALNGRNPERCSGGHLGPGWDYLQAPSFA